MTLLAHISDVHFGAVDRDAANTLSIQINDLSVDGVVVTGDLTQAGRKREFIEASAYLKTFKARVLVVPGNHDVPVYNLGQRFIDPWRRYRKFIDDNLCPQEAFGDAFVLGLNSARRAGPHYDWSLGRLSQTQLRRATDALSTAENNFKIVALHHPVTPGPGRAGQAVINKPQRALTAFRTSGADLVLTGHAHIAQAGVEETPAGRLIVAAAGTASSTRLRGEAPSFNLISFKDEKLLIETQRFDGREYVSEARHKFCRGSVGWRSL